MTSLWLAGVAIAVVGAGYGGIVAYMYGRQRALLYHGSQKRPTLHDKDLPRMREETVRTADGLELLSWYAPPANPGGRVIVIFHGNAGTLDLRADKVRPYLDAGLGVFLLAWRGFSGNPGQPSEQGLYHDADAALHQLEVLGHRREDLILFGESLGTAVATRTAVEHGMAALILEAPPLSIVKMGQRRYPWLPVGKLVKDRFETDSRIQHVQGPILIMHGKKDLVVPFEMGQGLAALASGAAEFRAFDEGAHTDLHEHGAVEHVLAFLRRNGLLEQT